MYYNITIVHTAHLQTNTVTGGTVDNRSLRVLRRKIVPPPNDIEVVWLTYPTRKNIYSAKSAAHIILFPIVTTILAEPRRDNFAPFRRHEIIIF